MFLSRVLGKLLLALAFGALAFDGARMLATPGGGLMLASLSDHFAVYAQGTEAELREYLLSAAPPFVWNSLVGPMLAFPLSFLLGSLGAILFLFGYRRPPPVIVSD